MKKAVLNVSEFLLSKSTSTVILLGLTVQIILVGKYLDNSVISPYMPTALDAQDYVERAQSWRTEGFTESFRDAYRMPGYSFIILTMQFLIPSNPYLGVKLLQLIAVALSAGIVKTILERYVPQWVAIIASMLYTVLPIWHFVPVLLAESLTSFIVVALIYQLSFVDKLKINRLVVFKISILIAAAVYLKPNNVVLLVVVSGFLLIKLRVNFLRTISTITLLFTCLLSPWIYFANHAQPDFFGLTTNSGINLYIGTGMIIAYDDGILSKSAIKWRVDPENNPKDQIFFDPTQSPVQKNSVATQKSVQIWKERPLQEIGYSLDKTLIAFGIKANSKFDYILGLFSSISLLSAIILLRFREHRAWGIALLITFISLALQAAIFQADRRFVIPVLYPFATVCLGLTIGNFSGQNFQLIVGNFRGKLMQSKTRLKNARYPTL